MVAVADGMGSRVRAAESATAACQAARDAIHALGTDSFVERHFVQAIAAMYRIRLGSYPDDQIGSTCLFSWARPTGELIVGACGDGAVIIDSAEGTAKVEVPARGWLNETIGVGPGAPWIFLRQPLRARQIVVLATDGVANDIVEGAEADFVAAIREGLVSSPPSKRSGLLQSELRRWPNPATRDDLTIAVHLP